MRIWILCLAAIAYAALPACKTMGITGETRLLHCPGGNCPTIMVTVRETGTSSAPKCEINVVPNLDLRADAEGMKTLSWAIAGGEYEFSDERYKYAIFIKDGSDPTGKFNNVTIQGSGKRLVIHFDHKPGTVAREFKYALTVKRPGNGGQFCETLDPWVIS